MQGLHYKTFVQRHILSISIEIPTFQGSLVLKLIFLSYFQESTKIESFTNTILNEDPLTLKLNDKESMKEKILFILWFPLIAIFWLSMNWLDVRKKEKRNFFAINYIFSIIIMRFLGMYFHSKKMISKAILNLLI